ncbi:MAG: hypothetical protein Q8R15_03135, partial [Candidatus Micrarchaeota archaeon]|nr:hypothetical protein [Candidatus Micrarchaeota archaeon]
MRGISLSRCAIIDLVSVRGARALLRGLSAAAGIFASHAPFFFAKKKGARRGAKENYWHYNLSFFSSMFSFFERKKRSGYKTGALPLSHGGVCK